MKRGDIVVVSAPGDFGKPRPALVVQSDYFNDEHTSVVVCLISSTIRDAPLFRLTIEPEDGNGLRRSSQIMIDRIVSLKRERMGQVVGRLDDDTMLRVNRALALWLGMGD